MNCQQYNFQVKSLTWKNIMAWLSNFLFSITSYFFISKFFGSDRKKTLVEATYEGFVSVYGVEVETGFTGLQNSSGISFKTFVLLYLLAFFTDLKLFPSILHYLKACWKETPQVRQKKKTHNIIWKVQRWSFILAWRRESWDKLINKTHSGMVRCNSWWEESKGNCSIERHRLSRAAEGEFTCQ